MDYRGLGSTGMQVSPLCLGAMMFGAWGEPDHDRCVKIVHRALDAGINFIDTADVYSLGESEQIVGKALAGGRREDVILATKFHAPMDVGFGGAGGDPNKRGNSRRWIFKEVEASLARLQTDWIDLYQVHRPEPGTDIEETLSALTDLRAQGKIRAFGCSTFPAAEIVEAHWTAQRRGLGRFATEQPPYSILVRAIEADVLPVAQRMAHRALAQGPGGATEQARPADTGSLRPLAARQPGKARGRRSARAARRAGGDRLDRHGARVHAHPPGGHLADHRPAHDGATGEPARGRGCDALKGRARPHR
jgi:aryl-alcohol dehydrogenase-like predicted oxidoreductase